MPAHAAALSAPEDPHRPDSSTTSVDILLVVVLEPGRDSEPGHLHQTCHGPCGAPPIPDTCLMQDPPGTPPPPIGLLTPDGRHEWNGLGWVPTWNPQRALPPRRRATKRDWLGRVAWVLVVFVVANIGVGLLTGNQHPSVALLVALAAAIVPLGLLGGWIRARATWLEIGLLAAMGAYLYVVGIFVGLSGDPVACPGAPVTDCDLGFGIGGMIGAAVAFLPLLAALAAGKGIRTSLWVGR